MTEIGTDVTTRPAPSDTLFAGRKVIWVCAVLAMGFFSLDGFMTFVLQSSAPQQAAASANASFHLIAVYVIARGLDAVLRDKAAMG